MERYVSISFMTAMAHFDDGNINDVYFKNGSDIVPVKKYRLDMDSLTKHKWFKREVIE